MDPRYIGQVTSLFTVKLASALPVGPSKWTTIESVVAEDRAGEYHFKTPVTGVDLIVGARASIVGDDDNSVIRVEVPGVRKSRNAATLDLRPTPVPAFVVGRVGLVVFTHKRLATDASVMLEVEHLAADDTTRAIALDPAIVAIVDKANE